MTDREFILWLMGLLDAPLSSGREAELLDRVRARLMDVRPSVPAASHPPHAGPSAFVSGPEELPSSCPRGSSSGVLDNEAALAD